MKGNLCIFFVLEITQFVRAFVRHMEFCSLMMSTQQINNDRKMKKMLLATTATCIRDDSYVILSRHMAYYDTNTKN